VTKNERWFATLLARPLKPVVAHHVGLPPDLAGGVDAREQLPSAVVLLIEVKDDGVFLVRFSRERTFAGDTWHQSVADAKEQARYEFGEALSAWVSVPVDVEDAVAFAFAQA